MIDPTKRTDPNRMTTFDTLRLSEEIDKSVNKDYFAVSPTFAIITYLRARGYLNEPKIVKDAVGGML